MTATRPASSKIAERAERRHPPRVTVDSDALELAFGSHDPRVHSYLHLASGGVVRLVEGSSDPWSQQRVDASEAYLRIPKIPSRVQHAWMEQFITSLSPSELAARLASVIGTEGAFRRFVDALAPHPSERKAWFGWRASRIRRIVDAWMRVHHLAGMDQDSWAARRRRFATTVESLSLEELPDLVQFGRHLVEARRARAATSEGGASDASGKPTTGRSDE